MTSTLRPNLLTRRFGSSTRHGVAAVMAALLLVFVLGMVALAVDLGYLYMSYNQLQTCSDSGALAGAQMLASDGIVKSTPDYTSRQDAARSMAVQFASSNKVGIDLPTVDSNSSNGSNGDVVIGYLADPENPSSPLDTSNPALYNAVQVRVRKTSAMNGQVTSFFARVWGNSGNPVAAKATALLSSTIVGFKVNSESGNSDLLPFAVKKTDWDALLAGSGSDDYRYDGAGNVVGGTDGILELNMFPLSNGTGGVVPGNFGTVDIGNPNNSTADLERQILYGVNSNDLSYFGGALTLGSDGTLLMNGDTGVSAGIKEELDSIKGRPRVVMLYSTVTQQGNNATYTIVGFVGVRIMYVKLTGAMTQKRIIVQPAAVIDASAVIGDTPNASKYVYSNVRLVR